jgi:histidinol phosphatase-like enzyme
MSFLSVYNFCPVLRGTECWYVTPTESLNLSQEDPHFRELYRKPNPGMLLLAVKRAKVPVKVCIMVGDRADDKTAAARAGVRNYWGICRKFNF